tara:strand:+ start:280 stop:465 length:186 start_codon:yes stop_codon:yes gene_type:complete
MKARASIFLEIDPEEFFMPVDGNPTDELTDMLYELLENLDGTSILNLKVKCTGVPKYETHE